MTNQFAVFTGALGYEFQMQARRRAIWITILLLGALQLIIYARAPHMDIFITETLTKHSLLYALATWCGMMMLLLPTGFGCLLADRLVRDRRTKTDELFITAPGALSARLLGKYLGSTCATALPFLLFYVLGVGLILYRTQNMLVLPLSLVTFATVILPGLLFVSAFSLACPLLMWVPLYQFCFIGYWFWGNDLGPRNGIPTLNGTLLTPDGKYMAVGFYGVDSWIIATPLQGVESILVLIGLAAFVLFVLWYVFKWQQARQ